MPADPKSLSELVAVHVLCWLPRPESGPNKWKRRDGRIVRFWPEWDIRDAFIALETWREQDDGNWYSIGSAYLVSDTPFKVEIHCGTEVLSIVDDPSLPRAICLALLKAVDVEIF